MSIGNENRCGNCKHFCQITKEEYERLGYSHVYGHFLVGHCDKVLEGTVYDDTLSDLTWQPFRFDGYPFEDECYDEDLHCFERRREEA